MVKVEPIYGVVRSVQGLVGTTSLAAPISYTAEVNLPEGTTVTMPLVAPHTWRWPPPILIRPLDMIGVGIAGLRVGGPAGVYQWSFIEPPDFGDCTE